MTTALHDFAPLLVALERGGVVAIATESFFGLLADVAQPDALERLVALKPRGADKGMPLVLPERTAWNALVDEIPIGASLLADAFWPGGFSLALRAAPSLDRRVTLDERVAVRLPGASLAASLVRAYGRPLTATSANRSGEAPATTSGAVQRSFPSAVADGTLTVWRDESADAPGGLPSTMVVFDAGRAWIARDGAVPRTSVLEVLERAGVLLDDGGPHR
jgi:L-threonylcarbamoyladenylate synthase